MVSFLHEFWTFLRVRKKFWLLPVFSAYLGPEFDQRDIDRRLTAVGARFSTVSRNDMLDTTAKALAEGEAIGWFQGRMEFGPRALGNRSILGDPRSPSMQKNLNLKVKYRESFQAVRPFSAARRGGELV